MSWQTDAKSNKHVKVITDALSKANKLILATDPDREGEAISWHLQEALDLPEVKTKRIVFSEITKKAILNAIEKPRQVNMPLVMAQQARRVLDRLVGYELSPVLSPARAFIPSCALPCPFVPSCVFLIVVLKPIVAARQ